MQGDLRASDPRLSWIVSEAALEFDEASKGRGNGEFTAAKSLITFLENSVDRPVAGGSGKLNFDVNTVEIIGNALSESAWNPQIMTVGEVANEAWNVAKSMEGATQNSAPDSLIRLRAFCVALGNNLLAHRRALREGRPSSPHRV